MNSTAHPLRRHAHRFLSLQLVVLLFIALATSGFARASKPSAPVRTIHDQRALADATGTTTRVSVASDGTQGNDRSISSLALSADGRYIAFQSEASNLVAGDANGISDVFVHDQTIGSTTLVSLASDGTQGNRGSGFSIFSADGRYIAFGSEASNLVAGDTNEVWDVFIRDLVTSITTRVSVASDGTQGNYTSYSPTISADGRYVAFYSSASNLVAGDSNGVWDVFVHDQTTGSTTLVSQAFNGLQGNAFSGYPSISADGRYVAFWSHASNLVVGDTNGEADVFVHDQTNGNITRVSLASAGTQGNNGSGEPTISADGRYVAFDSYASNLVAGDTNGVFDVFVHDQTTGSTTLVSQTSDGILGNRGSNFPTISVDGRYIAFGSEALNLVAGDTNGVLDVFVHDQTTGSTTLVSQTSDGTQGNNLSGSQTISADGRYIAFGSYASNLVAGDTNGVGDVFVRRLGDVPTSLTIAGRVSNASGAAIAGVAVSDGAGHSATTDSNGSYVVGGLVAGTVTLTPVKAGWTFEPPSWSALISTNVQGINFVGTATPPSGQKNPLIFVPGVMGSYIYDPNDKNNRELWPGICDGVRDDRLRTLARDKVLVTDVIRTYTGNPTGFPYKDCTNQEVKTYTALIERLKEGYTEYPDIEAKERVYTTPLKRCQDARDGGKKPTLFVFAYDWRQSNATSAVELKAYIDCVREIYGGQSKVDVLTHSMGGLVASRYLLDNKDNPHVARLITVAAPFLGTPRAITAINSGDYPGVAKELWQKALITPGELKYIAETAVGTHELLPSPAYFTLADGLFDCPFLQIDEGFCISFAAFQKWMDSRIAASDPGANTLSFHSSVQDDWRNGPFTLPSMPKFYHIYGAAAIDNTLAAVMEITRCSKDSSGKKYRCTRNIEAGSMTKGDQTVTQISASRIDGSTSYNAPGVTPIAVSGTPDETDHNGLVKEKPGVDKIIEVLKSTSSLSTVATRSATSLPAATELSTANANYIRATNVLSLTVTDQQGNINPSRVSFYVLDEGTYLAVLPNDETFTVTMHLKDQEGGLLDLRTGTGETSIHTIRYQDLLIDGNRQAQVVVGPQGFQPLETDANNDGVFETVLPPTVDVTGAGANDNEPPQVSISREQQGKNARVTITAMDASGVKSIYYSLDGTNFQRYTEPVDVDIAQTPTFFAFADDQLANRSGLITLTLAQRVFMPLTQR